jgi:hypothetical protein
MHIARVVQVQVQVILRPTVSRPVGEFVLVPGPLLGPWPDFNSLCLTISFFSVKGALNHIPYEQGVQSKVKVKSQGHVSVGRNFCYHLEGCIRSMQCNVELGYQLSSLALNLRTLTLVPTCAVVFFLTFFFFFFQQVAF